MNRLRIIVSVDWFPPAFRAGGPIKSAYNLCALLSKYHDVWVVTGSHDLGELDALDVPQDEWNSVQIGDETIQVRYCSKANLNRHVWSNMLKTIEPNFIHLNSMFSKAYSLLPLRASRSHSEIQVVLAPRGMLGRAALSLKPLKKRVFLSFARTMDLFEGVSWHASTSNEADEVRMHFRSANIRIAQNLPASLSTKNLARPLDCWKLVVIGRIHPVKNLEFGLRALLNADTSRPVELDFIGPVEDAAYQKELEGIASAQDQVKVRFHGGIPPSELPAFFHSAHYLLSSTTQENFGHSIVEAFAHGCPVLISDRTPWLQLKDKGIGWDWPLDAAVWQRGLSEALTLDQERWAVLSEQALAFFKTDVRNSAAEKANLELFQP